MNVTPPPSPSTIQNFEFTALRTQGALRSGSSRSSNDLPDWAPLRTASGLSTASVKPPRFAFLGRTLSTMLLSGSDWQKAKDQDAERYQLREQQPSHENQNVISRTSLYTPAGAFRWPFTKALYLQTLTSFGNFLAHRNAGLTDIETMGDDALRETVALYRDAIGATSKEGGAIDKTLHALREPIDDSGTTIFQQIREWNAAATRS